jgi:hypothetical protein
MEYEMVMAGRSETSRYKENKAVWYGLVYMVFEIMKNYDRHNGYELN